MSSKESFSFFLPTHIFFGIDSFQKIHEIVHRYNPKKILLVTGKNSGKKSGTVRRLKKILCDFEFDTFDKVDPNPSIDIIDKGIKLSKEGKTELVIGMGGGSALDAGKVIALMSKQSFSLETYFKTNKNLKKGLPCIAIPTTSGTGSEVTRWSSIWDHKKKKKFSMEHSFLFPEYCIIDPVLTLNKPEFLTAVTGLDALCHAVESYWSKHSNPISDSFAEKSIQLIVKNIKNTVKNPASIEHRTQMAKASLFAGLAFSQTKTTACHAISYPLTSHFKIPHGLACALSLPYMFDFNVSSLGQKAQNLAEWFEADNIESTSNKILDLMKSLDMPTRLKDINVEIEDIDNIFHTDTLTDRIRNNPKKITVKDLKNIIMKFL